MRYTKKVMALIQFFKKHGYIIAVLLLFCYLLFSRFYQIPQRSPFSWDQIDNAWAAKNILYNHQFPLVGMPAKLNSGFYIGPLYYYTIAIVYFFTHYDPIASGIFAGITAIIGFWTLFFVSNKLFTKPVTLMALIIQTVSSEAIHFDRVQWPVDFIPMLGLLAYYFLYQITLGKTKHILSFAIIVGLFWQAHFTAIFLPLIFILAMPFFNWTKKTFIYCLLALFIIVISLTPNIVSDLLSPRHGQSSSLVSYIQTYSHGFHLRRLIQVFPDTFIQMQTILPREIRGIGIQFFFLPFFLLYAFLQKQNKRAWRLLAYTTSLFYLIPLIIFTIYSGEASDYYYSINRFISIILMVFPFWALIQKWRIPGVLTATAIIGYYSYLNIYTFLVYPEPSNLPEYRLQVQQTVNDGGYINFTMGDPKSYLYFLYRYEKGEKSY